MNIGQLKEYIEKWEYEDSQELMCFGYDGRLYPLDGFESYAIRGAKLLASPRPERIKNKEEHKP